MSDGHRERGWTRRGGAQATGNVNARRVAVRSIAWLVFAVSLQLLNESIDSAASNEPSFDDFSLTGANSIDVYRFLPSGQTSARPEFWSPDTSRDPSLRRLLNADDDNCPLG